MSSPVQVNGTQDKRARRRSSISAAMSSLSMQLQQHPSQRNPMDPLAHNSTSPTQDIYATSPPSNGSSPNMLRPNKPGALSTLPRHLQSFRPTPDHGEVTGVRLLLLENINESAVQLFRDQGYHVDTEKGSLAEDELIGRLREGRYSALGIRSKTHVTKKVIAEVQTLQVVGCFCIGTNQVDLDECARAVRPELARLCTTAAQTTYSSRSVAELVIGEIICLSRQLCDRVAEMRAGTWNKVSKGCWEVRGKILGIVGYGHIGAQLSVLAEAMAMRVIYFDVLPIMPLGSADQVDTLDDLLKQSDFVTLHVPELEETKNMISTKQLALMKPTAYLINNARGTVVDLPALVQALKAGKLAGAAVDVYPREPKGNGPHFDDTLNSFATDLRSLPNVLLTPHIGGSTEEAQRMIGTEVGLALTRYINYGASVGAVNFPEVSLRPIIEKGFVRVCHVHQNQPGVLKTINNILGDFNVERQLSESRGDIAYVMVDIADASAEDVRRIYSLIMATAANVATRLLY